MAGATGEMVGTEVSSQAWECHSPETAAELLCPVPFGHYKAQGSEELLKG